MANIYFAKQITEKIGSELFDKIDIYYEYLKTSGRSDLYKRSWNTYYRPGISGGTIQNVGEQGEYKKIYINHFRNILQHILSLTISQRPAFEPRASNQDHKSMAQTILASGLLSYYLREKDLESVIREAVEKAVLLGEGYVGLRWNATSGEIFSIDSETKAPIYEGDVEADSFGPLDIIRDHRITNEKNHQWKIVRSWANRFDLASKFPEKKDEILSVEIDKSESCFRFINEEFDDDNDTDSIPVYTFYHKISQSLPAGRLVELVSPDGVLLDGPLPYTDIPVYKIVPSVQIDKCFGYTQAWDLLAVQEGVDKINSTIVTNQSTYGVQNIMSPKGNNLDVTVLANGLNLIQFDPKSGPPQSLNLLSTAPEMFQYAMQLITHMETLSGISATTRGNPESSLKSGSALALVQSLAVQFSQTLQHSYARLLENTGTGLINILKVYAKIPRIAIIAGNSNREYMKEFTGDDLDQIKRVMVDMGNPMTQTVAGRVNQAEMLLQGGLIENADQFLQVISTGRLEPLVHGKQKELMCISEENETLSNGQRCIAVFTDNHAMHIMEHKSVLASPEARKQPERVAVVMEHIQEHVDALKDTDPIVLQLLGQQPIMQQVPGQEGSSNQALPSNAISDQMEAATPLDKAVQSVRQPNLPTMPKNPMDEGQG